MTFVREEADIPNEEDVSLDDAELLLLKRPKFKKAKGVCLWCGSPRNERRSTSKYCCDQHRSDHHNYVKTQGFHAVSLAKRWRRYGRKGDFSMLSTIIDKLVAEDIVREEVTGVTTLYPNPPAYLLAKRVVQTRRR